MSQTGGVMEAEGLRDGTVRRTLAFSPVLLALEMEQVLWAQERGWSLQLSLEKPRKQMLPWSVQKKCSPVPVSTSILAQGSISVF